MMIGNRFVGKIDKEKNVFITHRGEKEHGFRLFSGLGFNKELIQRINDEIREIWVFYHKADGETVLLKTTPKTVIKKGREWKNTIGDVRDNQLILRLDKFRWC